MNMLVDQLKATSNITTTTNGDAAFKSTTDALVDLFYKIGACSDPEDAIPLFEKAFHEDPNMAVRILLYARDIRGGMGMRQVFRTVLAHVAKTHPKVAKAIIPKIPEVGRWDDILSVFNTPVEKQATFFWGYHLAKGDRNAAKWAPREKSAKRRYAKKLAKMIGCNLGEYRKLVAGHTNVVETQMSSGKWDEIDFSTVPSVASARYQKSFAKNATDRYTEYRDALSNGSPDVKVNAGAIFPHTVVQSLNSGDHTVASAQWAALPNYMEGCDLNLICMVDVSLSMNCDVMGKTTAMDVAVALGVYVSERITGAFKDKFITFESSPEFVDLSGLSFPMKVKKTRRASWGGSTNFQKAYTMILEAAIKNKVPASDMPEVLIVFSDMQFDEAMNTYHNTSTYDATAAETLRVAYEAWGYKPPTMIFWNLNGSETVPCVAGDVGNVLVSGFSPAIMRSVLSTDLSNITPLSMVENAVNVPRYDWNVETL